LANHRRKLYPCLQGALGCGCGRRGLKFFAWAYKDGGAMAAELDYVPLPAPLIAQVKATWTSSISSGGHPLWSGK